MIVYVPSNVPAGTEIVMTDVLVRAYVIVGADGKNVGVVQPLGAWAVKVIVPLKRSVELKCIVDVPDVPAIRYNFVGEADMLKLGFNTCTFNVIE